MHERISKRRPPDVNQLAASIVDAATSGEPEQSEEPRKDPAAVSLGRRGGKKGGPARAERLTAARRTEIARKAAEARWRTKETGQGDR